MAVSDTWAVLAKFGSGLEADIAVARLEAEEIPAHARGNDIVGIVGFGFQGPIWRGVDVLVPSELVDRAREILESDVEPDDEP
jgi:hypothetical protein